MSKQKKLASDLSIFSGGQVASSPGRNEEGGNFLVVSARETGSLRFATILQDHDLRNEQQLQFSRLIE